MERDLTLKLIVVLTTLVLAFSGCNPAAEQLLPSTAIKAGSSFFSYKPANAVSPGGAYLAVWEAKSLDDAQCVRLSAVPLPDLGKGEGKLGELTDEIVLRPSDGAWKSRGILDYMPLGWTSTYTLLHLAEGTQKNGQQAGENN